MNQLKYETSAHLPFLPQSLKLNIPKGIGWKFFGVFLVTPFLVWVGLGAFYVLALGIATLAHVVPERDDIDRKEQSSLSRLESLVTFFE